MMTMARPGRCQAQDNLGATARMISLLNIGVLAGKVGQHRAGLMWYMWRDVSWVGNILSDQDTNFTSQLLKEIENLQHSISRPLRPLLPFPNWWHRTALQQDPQIDANEGEGQGQTITIHTHLLFTYYDVPQVSTGFVAFELVCVWPPNAWPVGLKGESETEGKSNESVVP